jgi:hypothetical protein
MNLRFIWNVTYVSISFLLITELYPMGPIDQFTCSFICQRMSELFPIEGNHKESHYKCSQSFLFLNINFCFSWAIHRHRTTGLYGKCIINLLRNLQMDFAKWIHYFVFPPLVCEGPVCFSVHQHWVSSTALAI